MPPHDVREQLQAALGAAYSLERELGGGGMSRVFVATEIALAARLQHPHIVPLLTAGDADGLPYFTMPLVEGESLRARLAKHGELPLSEAIRLLREIAAALSYAHERGIVHRDIKPDNVLLSGGSAMITDFGVAKAISASSNSEAGSCWYVTFMACPAMSVPAGFSASGLPVGLQVVGRPRGDWSVLQMAHAFEQATRFGERRPTLP